MTDQVAPLPTSVSPEELCAPVIPDKDVDRDVAKSLPAMLGTESFYDFSISVSDVYLESLAFSQSDTREMVTPSLMGDFSDGIRR
jgi:hypothetical protein